MARIYSGTSGFAYREWRGAFYPEKLSPSRMLEYYSAKFPAVEINSTFYRMPNQALLERWRRQVPEGFKFCLKAPASITHSKRLSGAEVETERFLDAVRVLGPHLGPILFQLPPSLHHDFGLLRQFLLLIPQTAVAFEFRQ